MTVGIRRLDIATHFNGKELKPPEKTYTHRKQRSAQGGRDELRPEQPELFDAQVLIFLNIPLPKKFVKCCKATLGKMLQLYSRQAHS